MSPRRRRTDCPIRPSAGHPLRFASRCERFTGNGGVDVALVGAARGTQRRRRHPPLPFTRRRRRDAARVHRSGAPRSGEPPPFSREELVASLRELPSLAEAGRLLALAAVHAPTDDVVGGGTLHHLDAERKIVEIGYFVLPHARGRGVATTIARMLAEHAFSLGIERVAAYVNVGNTASERVVARAGFTREGIVRSMPKPDGRRVDKTLFSLLPGE